MEIVIVAHGGRKLVQLHSAHERPARGWRFLRVAYRKVCAVVLEAARRASLGSTNGLKTRWASDTLLLSRLVLVATGGARVARRAPLRGLELARRAFVASCLLRFEVEPPSRAIVAACVAR